MRIEGTQNGPPPNPEPPAYITPDDVPQQKHPIYANSEPTDAKLSNGLYHSINESSTDEDYVTVYDSVDNSGTCSSSKNGPGKNISVVYAKSNVKRTDIEQKSSEDESLYYARSNAEEEPPSYQEVQDSDANYGVGWEENAAYSSFEDNGASGQEDTKDGGSDCEGWEENNLYSETDTDDVVGVGERRECMRDGDEEVASEGWEDNALYSANNTGDTTEWMDNSIYADSNDQD